MRCTARPTSARSAGTTSASCSARWSSAARVRARRSRQDTGLNKSTVSWLVTELMELGLLVERGAERTRQRRPAGPRRRGRRRGRRRRSGWRSTSTTWACRRPTSPAARATSAMRGRATTAAAPSTDVLDRLGALARDALERRARRRACAPIGATVALPGLVDVARGTLLRRPEPALGGRRGRRAAAPSGSATRRCRSSADNEANLAALAELWEGAGARPARLHVRLRRGRRRRRHRARRRAVPRLPRLRRRVRPHDRGGRRACRARAAAAAAWRRAPAWSRCSRPPATPAGRPRPGSGEPVAELAARADAGDAAAARRAARLRRAGSASRSAPS